MMSKSLLIIVLLGALVAATMGESSLTKLKARIESGAAPAPCDKTPAGPPPPRVYLDQRLPHVVDDYHPPKGVFNPSFIPDKEVDQAARKILREIQAAEREAIENGDAPPAQRDTNLEMTTEEHTALKQLLLDADILVRHANRMTRENGPVSAGSVARSAIKKAASAEKKVAHKAAKKAARKAKRAAKRAARKAARKAKRAAKKAKVAAPQVGAVAPKAAPKPIAKL